MKKIVILLSAVALFAGVSCQKAESPVEQVKGRPVTLTVGLGAETRVSHDLDGTTIKPAWENTDYVFVKGDDTGAWEKFSIDEATISSDGKSASFVNENSVLEENETCTVVYATEAFLSDSTDPTTFSVATGQDGTLANLPEYLVAENVILGGLVELASQLTYFHFVGYFRETKYKLESVESVKFGIWGGNDYTGTTFTVTPDASVYTPSVSSGFSTSYRVDIDLYVAAEIGEQQEGTTYKMRAKVPCSSAPSTGPALPGHGAVEDSDADSRTYAVTWTSSKEYCAGTIYKKTF